MIAHQPIEDRLNRKRAKLAKVSNSQRRAIITACVRSIEVRPAAPRKRWDPDPFVFDWIA
ncbi:hypothetical protein [Streptomyces sp. NPDC094149]|uniref:hypothetical protein n=1 Tax=Streptomyces sp. NPDC094149 TaxID=3155079 RepID=UPI0033276EF8